MKRTIANFALSALTLLPAGAFADLIFEYGGHTYKLIESPSTWQQATAIAERMTLGGQPGYLARIDSEAENRAIFEVVSGRLSSDQLKSTVPDDGSGEAFIWLGASDAEVEGQWRWSNNGDAFWSGDFNGSPVGGLYTNWGIQPDDVDGREDALGMALADWPEPFYDLGEAGQWNDLDPAEKLFFVIEFDATAPPILANLEEPLNRSIQSGVGMIRGWALSDEEVERIQVYLDGEYVFDIPYGDPRPDVAAKFTEKGGAATSGFSVPFRYSSLSEGEHTVKVVVRDRFGGRTERTSSFEVVRFHKGYLNLQDTPNLTWAYTSAFGDEIRATGVTVDGVTYSLSLQWQARSQKFEITRIERLSPKN